MISKQVNLLRDAVIRLQALDLPNTANEVKEAADTIEELSAKLANANMERSTSYYNDGWIPVSERLPEERRTVWITEQWFDGSVHTYKGRVVKDRWVDCRQEAVLAWKYIDVPEPYQPKERSNGCL